MVGSPHFVLTIFFNGTQFNTLYPVLLSEHIAYMYEMQRFRIAYVFRRNADVYYDKRVRLSVRMSVGGRLHCAKTVQCRQRLVCSAQKSNRNVGSRFRLVPFPTLRLRHF